MIITVIYRMLAAMIAPVIIAFIFYILDSRTKFKSLNYIYKQIIIGLLFGILSCLATQFGVPYDGYIMNVRSAGPLTAGLIFGGPAGIISGIIGGLFRWFSIYWGIPSYTRVACSVATVLAGFIAAACRKYMFSDKRTTWFNGLFIALATETFHMLLIFMTHLDNIKEAFNVVKVIAIPMIIANSISLCISLILISFIGKEKIKIEKNNRQISTTFSIYLLICVIISFILTSLFTSFLENKISHMEVERLLTMTVDDVKSDIQIATDRQLLIATNNIADAINKHYDNYPNSSKEVIRQLMRSYAYYNNVSEVSIIDENGYIYVSTTDSFDGFNMATGGQAEEFLCLLNGTDSYVQKYQPMDYDNSVYRKYAGVTLSRGGFVQVGYDSELFHDAVESTLIDVAKNRHIGQTGFVFIYSPKTGEVISSPEGAVSTEYIISHLDEINAIKNDEVLFNEESNHIIELIQTEEEYILLKSDVEGYSVVACIPHSEADFSRNISVYISGFMQLIVFFMLFVVVFFLIKRIIIDNIHKINKSLEKITAGDLSTRVDIHENQEFESLSNDINSTVSRLKELISDAEKRIDMELEFAKSIQYSVLPSIFPPYPNRTDFDIYATMKTAREVGGDFYDFYMLGEDKLVFMIADVSGKGIPAAMFMMNAKSLIKSRAETGLGVADVFTEVNKILCSSNKAGMFVTAWIGKIDLKTGVVKYSNAGHNPPLIRRANGSFEYFKSKPNLVLAGMDGIVYRENELLLNPGDEIFLYTDGVTEANDSNNGLFGENRLHEILNSDSFQNSKSLCNAVNDSLNEFVGSASQFDDITMLSLKYYGVDKIMKEITVPATLDSLETVTNFLEEELELNNSSMKSIMQINVATDEILGNIIHYAYPESDGNATVGIKIDDQLAVIVFKDNGIPFNPLERKDPDVSLSAEEREIGGLGIYMVKKTMDSVAYEYKNGQNIFTITKSII